MFSLNLAMKYDNKNDNIIKLKKRSNFRNQNQEVQSEIGITESNSNNNQQMVEEQVGLEGNNKQIRPRYELTVKKLLDFW